MLLVAHGTLCIIDGVDAGIKSKSDIVEFMLNSNILAWGRFVILAYNEVNAWYMKGKIDKKMINEYLDIEYKKLMNY